MDSKVSKVSKVRKGLVGLVNLVRLGWPHVFDCVLIVFDCV